MLWSREGSDNRPGAWYEPNHFVPLYSVTRDGFGKSEANIKEESSSKPIINNGKIEQAREVGDLKKKAILPVSHSGEIHKAKSSKKKMRKVSTRLLRDSV